MKKGLLCTLLILLFACFCFSSFSATTEDTLVPAISFASGEQYVLGLANITDNNKVSGEFSPAAIPANEYGLDYVKRPTTLSAAAEEMLLWTITQKEDGTVTLYSEAAEQYLHLEPDVNNENAGRAYLSDTPQDLQANVSGGKIQIYTVENNTTYYFRFTNLHTNSCLHSGPFTSSNLFTLYTTSDKNAVKEYDNTGKTPLLTVGCFADLHVDYGIQSWKTPIRQGTVDAVDKLVELGGADIVLVGGDILSTNDTRSPWTNDLIKKAQDTVYKTLLKGSNQKYVLPVTGNHDSEPGNAAGGTVYSGDWESYLELYAGEYDAYSRNESSKFKELLGYRYNLYGMEFVCINTPYLPTRSSGLYTSQAAWLEEQLEDIGKDKTVVVLCHYPVVHSQYPITTVSGGGDARKAFEDVLKKYPNVLWCYGHVHHSDFEFAHYSAAEKITPSQPTTKNADDSYSTNGYISCHMGSMGYYNNKFQPGGLQAAEPQIVQFMKMDFYEDHITFTYYNTGEKSAVEGVYELASYTIRRDLSQLEEIPSENDGTNNENNENSETVTSESGGSTNSKNTESTDSSEATDSTDTEISDSITTSEQAIKTESSDRTDASGTKHTDSNASSSEEPNKEETSPWGIVLVVAGSILILGGGGIGLWYFLKKKKA